MYLFLGRKPVRACRTCQCQRSRETKLVPRWWQSENPSTAPPTSHPSSLTTIAFLIFVSFCKLSEVFVKLFLVFVKLCRTTFDYWRCPWVSHRHSIQCVQCNNVQPWACIQTGIQCWAVSVTEIIFRQLLKLTNLFTRGMKIGQWKYGKTIILFSHSVTGFSDNWVSQLVTFLEVGAFFDPCHIV